MNICLDNWKHRLGLESVRAALSKWAACTRLSFQKLLQTRLICRNNTKKCFEMSNDTSSLSLRVQTTINHILICFLPQYQRQKKNVFFRARAEKGIAWHIDASSVVWTLKDFCCSSVSMLCYKTNGKRHSLYYWVMDALGRFAKHSRS